MASTVGITSEFIANAPPGELADVVKDIKTLTSDSGLIPKLKPAFEKYNEDQLITTKLHGSSQPVLICKHNKLSDGRYFDVESNTSFDFDHTTQKASSLQPYNHDSPHTSLASALLKSLSTHFVEHYPSSSGSAYSVIPSSDSIHLILVSTKSSAPNFVSGRWRSTYTLSPSTQQLTGTIQVNVHYYEDGNVALTTTKSVTIENAGSTGAEVVKKMAAEERKYQEELNKSFVQMNENSFKALRRQLPVTRQKVEWEKVGGYRLGSDLRGGVSMKQ